MKTNPFKLASISLITFWLCIFGLLPFVLTFMLSFLSNDPAHFYTFKPTLSHYTSLIDPLFLRVFIRSFFTALITTTCCLLIGYPFAYALARLPKKVRTLGLFLVIIPFWTSSLIRSFAIITIIKAQGLLNQVLLHWHWITHPLQILYTPIASQIGLIYTLLPFMILPIYSNLEKFDWRLLDAAADLGAKRCRRFWQVVLPISMPGILSGILLVFLPAMTLFYIPDILGGAKSLLLGNLIYSEFLDYHNWPLGASISIVLTAFMFCLMMIYLRFSPKRSQGNLS
jgi:spermidine/putrescine transport system permease protein